MNTTLPWWRTFEYELPCPVENVCDASNCWSPRHFEMEQNGKWLDVSIPRVEAYQAVRVEFE